MSLALKGPMSVNLSDIKTTFFTRINLSEERIQVLIDLYEAGVAVKPVILTEGDFELIDGRHRVESARRLGKDQVSAFTTKIADRKERIIESVRCNVGGAMPPSQSDFEHTIELLLNNGMKKREIVEMFPLPKTLIAKYYESVMNKIYKRKIGRAIEHVIKGEMSIVAAADKFGVRPEDLRTMISNRKQRGENLASSLGVVEGRVRSLGVALGKNTTIMLNGFREGEIDRMELKKFRDRIRDSSRRLASNAEQIIKRLDDAMDRSTKSLEMTDEPAEEARV